MSKLSEENLDKSEKTVRKSYGLTREKAARISMNTQKAYISKYGEYLEAYNTGYEDALKAVMRNLEQFCKDAHEIRMIYEGCDIDTYEGESECTKFITEQVLGYLPKELGGW